MAAKKTQREKDWPMIARLVEANLFANRDEPAPQQVDFWLRELRTPRLLEELAQRFPDTAARLETERPLVRHAIARDRAALRDALAEEKRREQEADAAYWRPLREQLQRLRAERRRQ